MRRYSMSRYDVPKNSRKPPPKSSGAGEGDKVKLKAGVVEYSTVVSAYAALGDMPSALRVIQVGRCRLTLVNPS